MPFKIVQTIERGAIKLFTVPSGWESQGQLRYPKKPNESALVKNENSKPRADWRVLSCKVKRMGFLTYADAEEELSIMLQHSDTDTGTTIGEAQRETQFTTEVPDFNNMADLIYHSQSQTSNVTEVQPVGDDTFWIIGDSNEIAANLEPAIPPQPDTHKLNTIIENQKKIMDMQNKFSYRLSNFIIEIETTIDKAITRTLSRHLDQSVVNLGNARNAAENSSFKLKPIDSINDLENLELLLMDPVERNKLMKMYSIVCSAADGHGITCAYKLIDLLFTREFLCKCSWSGGSRGSTIKLPLKKYINILDFCFKLIYSWDKSYTIEDNENFFKLVLRNAEQRKNFKNLRKPSKRNRSNKKQTEKVKKPKIVGTNATVSEDVGSKTKTETSKRAEVEEETVKEIDMEKEVEEETVKEIDMEKEVEEQTVSEDGMEEETTSEIDMEEVLEEEIVNGDGMEEETTNESHMEDETINVINTEEETRNEIDVEEKTTNETYMEEETTDMEEVARERVKEKYDNEVEKASKDISKNVDENVVKVAQLAEEVEKYETIAKDTETQDNKEKKKVIEVKEDLKKETKMRSYIEKDVEKNEGKEKYTKEVEKEIYIKEKQKAARENNKNEKENTKRKLKQNINAENIKKINNIYVKKESSRYVPKKQPPMVAKKIKGLHPSSQTAPQNQQSITAIKKDLDDKRLRKMKRLDHGGQSGQTPPKRLKPNATIISEVKTND